MAVFERSSKLMYLNPEPGWDDEIVQSATSSTHHSPYSYSGSGSGTTHGSHASSSGDHDHHSAGGDYSSPASATGAGSSQAGMGDRLAWTRTPMIRTPKAYGEVVLALQRIEDDLPPNRRTKWDEWDGNAEEWQFAGDSSRREVFLLVSAERLGFSFAGSTMSVGAILRQSSMGMDNRLISAFHPGLFLDVRFRRLLVERPQPSCCQCSTKTMSSGEIRGGV